MTKHKINKVTVFSFIITILLFVCVVLVIHKSTKNNEVAEEDPVDTAEYNSTLEVIDTTTEAEDYNIDSDNMTAESISQKGGMKVLINQNTVSFNEIEATRIEGTSTWKNVVFYVFDNTEDSKEAFDYVVSDVLVDSVTTDNTVIGQRAEAVNLQYIEFYYLTGNMLVMHTDFIGDPGNDIGPSEKINEDNMTMHEKIINFW